VARNVSKPLSVNMGLGIRQRPTTPLIPARKLQDMGVAAVSYPRLLTAAAIQGMKNALGALGTQLETGEIVDRTDLLVSFKELNELMGIDRLKEIEQRFLTEAQLKSKYGT
jgi:2-methylisocitrate lyase-like PEP mutase family enzyme